MKNICLLSVLEIFCSAHVRYRSRCNLWGKKKRKTDFHADHNLNHSCLNTNNNLVFASVPILSFCFFLSEPQIFSCAGQAIRRFFGGGKRLFFCTHKGEGGREGGEEEAEGASGGGRFHFWQDIQM